LLAASTTSTRSSPFPIGAWGRLYSVLFNHRVPRRSKVLAHETAYNLSMISHVVHQAVPPRLVAPRLPGHAVAGLEQKLAASGVGAASRLLVVHPGNGNDATPRWPPESFAAVAAQLAAEADMRVVVTGSAFEAALVDRVVARCPGAVSLAGVLTIEELMVLLARAALVLSNSTGPTHLASVFDTPVVAVFAARDLLRWRLTNRRGASLIPPDGTLALGAVSTDAVLAEARRVLAIPASGPAAAGSVAVVGSDTGTAPLTTRPPPFPV
jgi:ADP-heptose:LPS heptosyltransferase